MNLYLASLFSLPLTKLDSSRQSLTYEEVVKGLDEDVLTYETGLGVGSGFSELLSLEIKVEKGSYDKGLNWLRDIVWGTKFDVERLRVGVAKLKQSLPEQKRDGRTVSVQDLRMDAPSSEKRLISINLLCLSRSPGRSRNS